ncbi:MAG: hypothetical protein SGARI_000520, partial [Bacillariaceae sp.]
MKEAADEGSPHAAYMAGIRFKNRLLGDLTLTERGSQLQSDNSTAQAQFQSLGVLQTDKLAFKYLTKASSKDDGLGVAMTSLAECYEKGQGCEQDMRECSSWLWRACLQNTPTAISLLDAKTLIVREHMAQLQNMSMVAERVGFGQAVQMGGPNISALLLAMNRPTLKRILRQKLKPFAGDVPSYSVGQGRSRPHDAGTTLPVQMVGTEQLQELLNGADFLYTTKHVQYQYMYCRRGTAKAATAQTQGHATRALDSPTYRAPPQVACDETLSEGEVREWVQQARRSPQVIAAQCIHTEAAGISGGRPVCDECIQDAIERLWVVSHGSVVLSLQEALAARGQTAIFRNRHGKVRSETFKTYGRGDVECVLAALVAGRADYAALVCHPIFVAQDPNLFWPLIHYHGSVRAALEYVAPHEDWDSLLGGIKSPPESLPLLDEISGDSILPDDSVTKCGSDLCFKLWLPGSSGSYCAKCQRRSYCSRQCHMNDWPLHKAECVPASKGMTREPKKAEPSKRRQKEGTEVPKENEEVLVHGLKAKPEFNGRLARVTGDRVRDRYPILVSGQGASVLMKETNFYRLGVGIRKTDSNGDPNDDKVERIECLIHGSTLCRKCCFDFTTVNQLLSMMDNSNTDSRITDKTVIETITETHFAGIRDDWGDGEVMEGTLDPDIPMECQGLKNEDRRKLLKALLALKKSDSLVTATAIAGMTTYSG